MTTFTINELLDKRAELAGLIIQSEKHTRDLRADLAHVEATLRIMKPGIELGRVVPKHVQYRARYFKKGELARTIRDYLREHQGSEVAVADIMPLAISDRVVNSVEHYKIAVGAYEALRRMERSGEVTRTGEGWKEARFRLAGEA